MSNYNDSTMQVYEYYKTFGKVRTINAMVDDPEIQEQTYFALLPQIMFMIGAKKSGKTSLGKHAAHRTNFKLINLKDFIK